MCMAALLAYEYGRPVGPCVWQAYAWQAPCPCLTLVFALIIGGELSDAQGPGIRQAGHSVHSKKPKQHCVL